MRRRKEERAEKGMGASIPATPELQGSHVRQKYR